MALQGVLAPGLRETDLHALQQYQKIIRFRDEVFAGKHATIKVPGSLREAALSLPSDGILECTPGNRPGQDNAAFASKRAVGSFIATPNVVPPPKPRSVPLSKSDELLCAELQRQRKKIEQDLWEDVQRNGSQQVGSGAQQDIDASAVLAEALLLVPEVKFPAQIQEGAGSANGPEHDSFDDNTFYSSQHDTPEFQPASPAPASSAAPAASAAPAWPPPADKVTTNTILAKTRDERRSVTKQRQLRTYDELTETPAVRKQPRGLPGLNNYADNSTTSLSQPNATASSATASVGGQMVPTQPSSYIDLHPPSPLLQNNTRALPGYPATGYSAQPPQPGEIPGLYGGTQNSVNSTGAPAQVAALRSEPGSRTSPESSSQGGQGKRKNKKKKRKSDRRALESQQSFESSTHHIKAEPRSPSPLPGPSYIRPSKRRRQLRPQNQDSAHDEMSYDPAMPSGPSKSSEAHRPFQERQGQALAGYEGSGVYFAAAPAASNDTRVSRDHAAEHVVTDDGYRREHLPQVALPPEYSSREPHMGRTAQGDVFPDAVLPYRGSPQPARYSVHPEGAVFHEAPRPHHSGRILYDAYGREYIEPPRQIIRQSMAPSPLPGEPDRLYARPPVQPLARFQGPGALDERGYMFAQPASPYVAPRRVLTQPEYVTFENREGRYREYSTRPLATAGEFVSTRPQEHRIYAEAGREYINRASSAHPVEQSRVGRGLGSHDSNVRRETTVVLGDPEPGRIWSYGQWPGHEGLMVRPGGVSAVYTEAGSSRSAVGQDARYGRGSMQEGFRQ